MNVIGVLLGCIFIGMGIGFVFLLIDQFTESKGIPKMKNPPAPPKKCICNDIGKHSPGGRCESCHSKRK